MNTKNSFQNNFISYVNGALGLMGLITIILVTLSVITRFVFKFSITWSDEVLRLIFIWCYFIGSAILYFEGGLMRLELIDENLKNHQNKSAYLTITFIQNSVILAFFTLISYYSVLIVKGQIATNQLTTTSGTPAWFPNVGFTIGMILMVVFSVQKLLFILKENKKMRIKN